MYRNKIYGAKRSDFFSPLISYLFIIIFFILNIKQINLCRANFFARAQFPLQQIRKPSSSPTPTRAHTERILLLFFFSFPWQWVGPVFPRLYFLQIFRQHSSISPRLHCIISLRTLLNPFAVAVRNPTQRTAHYMRHVMTVVHERERD